MRIGDTVHYNDGESVTLLDVKPGILQASAFVQITYTNWETGTPVADTKAIWVPLAVRWTHPSYFLQHIAFYPS